MVKHTHETDDINGKKDNSILKRWKTDDINGKKDNSILKRWKVTTSMERKTTLSWKDEKWHIMSMASMWMNDIIIIFSKFDNDIKHGFLYNSIIKQT